MTIIGIGNVLQKDDGLGVYSASYLNENYNFSENVQIINGGVEGIHLFNVLEESDHVVVLDCLQLNDDPASIYAIPAQEISGYGLNNGGTHEIGIYRPHLSSAKCSTSLSNIRIAIPHSIQEIKW